MINCDECMLIVDVKKAHLMAPAVREVFIQIPKEDMTKVGGDQRCGKL